MESIFRASGFFINLSNDMLQLTDLTFSFSAISCIVAFSSIYQFSCFEILKVFFVLKYKK